MSHLWRQLLTGDARCVHWSTFTSTVCLVTHHLCDVVATHCGGGVTLTALNWSVWIPNLNFTLQPLLSPFIPIPVCWQHLPMPIADPHQGYTLCGSSIWIPGDTRSLCSKQSLCPKQKHAWCHLERDFGLLHQYPRISNPYCWDIQIRKCEWWQGNKMTQTKSLTKNS